MKYQNDLKLVSPRRVILGFWQTSAPSTLSTFKRSSFHFAIATRGHKGLEQSKEPLSEAVALSSELDGEIFSTLISGIF